MNVQIYVFSKKGRKLNSFHENQYSLIYTMPPIVHLVASLEKNE